jgi:hypothetical protein
MHKHHLFLGDSVASFSTTLTSRFGKLAGAAAIATALCASPSAQADILDFEVELESPFMFSGARVEMGNFWVRSYGGTQAGDFVGAVVNNDSCFGISCPVNNPTNYYTGLDDGFFVFGRANNTTFRLKSFEASFIGVGQASFPAVSGLIVLQGYNANGIAIGGSQQYALGGPVGGSFKFADYSAGAFGNTLVSSVRVLGYSCDASGGCNRTSNLANFAIDNIALVPEPMSWALMGLGLLGVAAFSRRRSA